MTNTGEASTIRRWIFSARGVKFSPLILHCHAATRSRKLNFMSDGDAIIAGDGPYTLLANTPEMYLQYRADGTVWCRWPDGVLVEVVRKSDAQAEADFRSRQGELLPSDPQDYRQLWERDQLAKKELFEQREQFRRERDAALEELRRHEASLK